ncbi:Na+/solute symporter [Pseudomonas savastanoi pv. glycinea]|uniref:Sodium:solute symporter protein n=1 Tax=Pseudomonas savastanoi pv. glycinea TaxID=318 RepID=A0A3M3K403_PSESG|nr:Na+/solute symporter [Pseudomonas savastanoi pv. glycinea]RMO52515.1 Sodium:solute symporter protein [Pseudomonas savastanoi pv. glycinea]
MISTTMVSDLYITFGLIGVFLAGMIAVLYATNRKSESFSDYAVGGRSYGPWFIAMCYTNSWWPGATFTAFFALSVGGALGFYGMVYATLGVTAMYLMANRAWTWGKRFNLTTQPDLLGMRFNSPVVKRIASIIGIISVFPWVVMGIQALATVFSVRQFRPLGRDDLPAGRGGGDPDSAVLDGEHGHARPDHDRHVSGADCLRAVCRAVHFPAVRYSGVVRQPVATARQHAGDPRWRRQHLRPDVHVQPDLYRGDRLDVLAHELSAYLYRQRCAFGKEGHTPDDHAGGWLLRHSDAVRRGNQSGPQRGRASAAWLVPVTVRYRRAVVAGAGNHDCPGGQHRPCRRLRSGVRYTVCQRSGDLEQAAQ